MPGRPFKPGVADSRGQPAGCCIVRLFGDKSLVTNTCRVIRSKILSKLYFGRKIIELYYHFSSRLSKGE